MTENGGGSGIRLDPPYMTMTADFARLYSPYNGARVTKEMFVAQPRGDVSWIPAFAGMTENGGGSGPPRAVLDPPYIGCGNDGRRAGMT
jgi:hypothetical protein